jgi:hypothetical protein
MKAHNIHVRTASAQDVPDVIALRDAYAVERIGKSVRGFVTSVLLPEMLERCVNEHGVIIATEQSAIVGYSVLMSMRHVEESAYYELAEWYRIAHPEKYKQTVLVRQYCVERAYRGGAVVKRIFSFQADHLVRRGIRYTIGEVDPKNRVSLVCAQRILGYHHIGDRCGWWVALRNEGS